METDTTPTFTVTLSKEDVDSLNVIAVRRSKPIEEQIHQAVTEWIKMEEMHFDLMQEQHWVSSDEPSVMWEDL